MSQPRGPAPLPTALLGDIKALIEEGRRQAVATVNMGLTLLYWRIGQRIHAEILHGERAAYGEQIVATLSRQLVAEYGRGYTEKNLRRMGVVSQDLHSLDPQTTAGSRLKLTFVGRDKNICL